MEIKNVEVNYDIGSLRITGKLITDRAVAVSLPGQDVGGSKIV